MNQQALAKAERAKASMTLPALIRFLNNHPERHTPFMDRWAELCIRYETQVYPAKPQGASEGKRLRYGKPSRIVECLESCARFGMVGTWFVKVVG